MIKLTPADKYAEAARLVIRDYDVALKTSSGIIIPDTKFALGVEVAIAEVVSLSWDMKQANKVVDDSADDHPMMEVGALVLVYRQAGTSLQIEGVTYRLITGSDVNAYVDIAKEFLVPKADVPIPPEIEGMPVGGS